MGTGNEPKLKNLLRAWPAGMVATYPWLKKYGIYQELASKYLKSVWIERIGTGAFKKAGDIIDWPGVVYALQQQLKMDLHIGSLWSLELRGFGHFARFENEITLLGQPNTKLPSWCSDLQLPKVKLHYVTNKLFNKEHSVGLSHFEERGFGLIVSSPERAIMELLWQMPQKYGFDEAAYVMENLISLRPKLVQSLLEYCTSVKTKRLFMYLATECNHTWLKKISLDKVNFGSGIRQIDSGHTFNKTYQLYVPESHLSENKRHE